MATTHAKNQKFNGKSKAPLFSRAARPTKWQPMRWTHKQYHEMAERGYFEGKRVELIGGEIIEMAPMLSAHWTSVVLVNEKMREVFANGFLVTVQLPLKLPNISEPEPDIAIIRGSLRDFADGLPQTAVLVIEISDSTLRLDRTDKASLYAAAGIEDYWIVNVKARKMEVHRAPVENEKAKFGWIYQEKTEYKEDDTASPLAAPHAKIKVADLLP